MRGFARPPNAPTKWPTAADVGGATDGEDAATAQADEPGIPPLPNVPRIDAHNHAHTLSRRGRERYALSGCAAMVTVAGGYQWLTGATAADGADAIERYSPGRITLDTDAANVLRSDVDSIERSAFELARFGVDEDAIRQVVYENPASTFGFEA